MKYGDKTQWAWLDRFAPYATAHLTSTLTGQYRGEPAEPDLGKALTTNHIKWVDVTSLYPHTTTQVGFIVDYTTSRTTRGRGTVVGLGDQQLDVVLGANSTGTWTVTAISTPPNTDQ